MVAVDKKKYQVAKIFLERKADVNIKNDMLPVRTARGCAYCTECFDELYFNSHVADDAYHSYAICLSPLYAVGGIDAAHDRC